jgi:multidrug efflux pump subunit AcrB
VLTTIAAFAPLLFVGGIVGPFFEAMSMVVILCLMFSLVLAICRGDALSSRAHDG